jgi:hypothetical protein
LSAALQVAAWQYHKIACDLLVRRQQLDAAAEAAAAAETGNTLEADTAAAAEASNQLEADAAAAKTSKRRKTS